MMADESRIEPPEGSNWQAQSPYGLQRFKSGPDGCLVRLADVVRWLMQARELPLIEAVQAVCAPLEGDAPPLVYRLDTTSWAQAEDQYSPWLYFDAQDLEGLELRAAWARLVARNARAAWLMKPYDLARGANAPGYPVEYDSAKETPFEFSERADRTGGPKTAAVPFAVAHELWGWGTVAAPVADPVLAPTQLGADDVKDYAALCRYLAPYAGKKGHEKPNWKAEWVSWVRAEEQARGRGWKTAVAGELGMSRQGLDALFGRFPEQTLEKATFSTGLGQRSKAA